MNIPTLAHRSRSVISCVAFSMFVSAGLPLAAQRSTTASPPSPFYAAPGAAAESDDEIYELSPFSVEADQNASRYQATSTLAGTRVRTDLKDIASSISVVTAEFLQDTGATSSQDLLVYTTNTEVGGVQGNFAGVGNTFINGASESGNFLRPSQNTRVRGLDSADDTRDFIPTNIPWDSYIVGRVDLQRGPNSILFGLGSPAGIVNTSINSARLHDTSGSIENRFDRFGSMRWTIDYNRPLVDDQLAVRLVALDSDTKYRQKPAYNQDRRIFGALRWEPQLGNESAATSIRLNYENGRVRANRPRVLPPQDRISSFFSPTGINRQTWDPWYAWEAGVVPYSNAAREGSGIEAPNYHVVQYSGPGLQLTNNPVFTYSGADATAPSAIRQAGPNTYWGLADNGTLDSGIDGFPFGSNIGIASFNEVAFNHHRENGPTLYPAADKGFYKTRSLTDPRIFDFYNNLIDGPNKRETQNWDAYNLVFDQTFMNDRVGFQLLYDSQEMDESERRNLDNAYISVDIRENLMVYPWAYPDLAVPNPNAGRAFVGQGTKSGHGRQIFSDRENFRATLFGEIRAEDFMGESGLSKFLGRHILTGLYSTETYDEETRNHALYAAERKWSDRIGYGGDGSNPWLGDNRGGLNAADIVVDWMTYLSGDLRNQNNALNLNLPRITGVQSPHGEYNISYYDSHWNAPGVNPSTPWRNPARSLDADPPGEDTTESNNPRNYAGWTSDTFYILNSDRGEVSRLYTDISRKQVKTESEGITWQGYWWDDHLVTTIGYREDTQTLRSGSSASADEAGGAAVPHPDLDPLDPDFGRVSGDSTSWGVVFHVPEPALQFLPDGTGVSLFYNEGRNSRVENRYGFDARALPIASGETTDYGVVINAFNNRLQLKVTRYETSVNNANLITGANGLAGENTYYLRNLEGWGTASALMDLAGMEGNSGVVGWEWYWNWAMIAGEPGTGANAWDAAYWNPAGSAEAQARFWSHPETITQQAAVESWLDQMLPQSWFDAYGFPINVAAAAAGDVNGAFTGRSQPVYPADVQPSGGGRVNGVWPTGTGTNISEGYEYELAGQPIDGWNIALNASKQHASQVELGENLVNFIESSYEKYQSPAGDLRLWWGQDLTVRDYYTQNVWSAYQFHLQTNGKLAPEMSPWRANLITNYTFQENFKGLNIGLGYRWQQGTIIGYTLNDDRDNLDVNRPYWGKSQSAVDMWLGYERPIRENVTWRIQLNTRNLGEDPHLVPISVQPDGSPAGFRINEGFTWTLTNTISF